MTASSENVCNIFSGKYDISVTRRHVSPNHSKSADHENVCGFLITHRNLERNGKKYARNGRIFLSEMGMRAGSAGTSILRRRAARHAEAVAVSKTWKK